MGLIHYIGRGLAESRARSRQLNTERVRAYRRCFEVPELVESRFEIYDSVFGLGRRGY